jgi:hypothetical protein
MQALGGEDGCNAVQGVSALAQLRQHRRKAADRLRFGQWLVRHCRALNALGNVFKLFCGVCGGVHLIS